MGNGTDLQYQLAAKKHQIDGELEIDDLAVVSNGDDDGAYVQAWIWVEDKELGEFCQHCGAGMGIHRREGEGTCLKCDPEGAKRG